MADNDIIHIDTENLSQEVYRFINKSGPWIKIVAQILPYRERFSIQIILQENSLTDAHLFICKDNGMGNNNNYMQITQDSECCLFPVSRLITLSFNETQIKLVFEDHQGLTLLFEHLSPDINDHGLEIFVSQFRICASVSKNSIEDPKLRLLNSNFLQRNSIPETAMPNNVFYDAFSIPTCVFPVVYDHDGAGETWIKRNRDLNAAYFTEPVEVTVCCLTWNVGGGGNPSDDPSVVKDLSDLAKSNYDMYFIAFQEIDMSVQAVLTGNSPMTEEWTKCIRKAFNIGHKRTENTEKQPSTKPNTEKPPIPQNKPPPRNPNQPIPKNPFNTMNPTTSTNQNSSQNQLNNQNSNQNQSYPQIPIVNQSNGQNSSQNQSYQQMPAQNQFNTQNPSLNPPRNQFPGQYPSQIQSNAQNPAQNPFSGQNKSSTQNWNQIQAKNPFNTMDTSPTASPNNSSFNSQANNLISFDNMTPSTYPVLPELEDLIDLTGTSKPAGEQTNAANEYQFDLEIFSSPQQNSNLNVSLNSNLISSSNNSFQNPQMNSSAQQFQYQSMNSSAQQFQNPQMNSSSQLFQNPQMNSSVQQFQYPQMNSGAQFYPNPSMNSSSQQFSPNSSSQLHLNPNLNSNQQLYPVIQYPNMNANPQNSSGQLYMNQRPYSNPQMSQNYIQGRQPYPNPAQQQQQQQQYPIPGQPQTSQSYSNFNQNQGQGSQPYFNQTQQPQTSQSFTNFNQNQSQSQNATSNPSSKPSPKPQQQQQKKKEKSNSYTYKIISPMSLGGVYACIIIRDDLSLPVSFEQPKKVRLGLHGMTANKSAIVYPVKIGEFARINFIGCHLSAGHGNVESRLSSMKELMNTNLTVLSRNSSSTSSSSSTAVKSSDKFHSGIEKVDYIVLIGDLNYRINLSYEECLQCIHNNDLDKLVEKDQLNAARKTDPDVARFEEGPISFLPTYKFDKRSDVYDTSQKMRVPSYTDRILVVTNKNKKDEADDDSAWQNDPNDNVDMKDKFIFETDIVHDLFPKAKGLQDDKHFSSDLIPNSFPSKPKYAFYFRGTNQFSDHRPVQGILIFKIPKSISAKLEAFKEVQLKRMDEMSALAMPQIDPKSSQIMMHINKKVIFQFKNISNGWMRWHAFVEKKNENDVVNEIALSPERGVVFPDQICELKIAGLKRTQNTSRTIIIESIDQIPLAFIEVIVS